jgi:hypothetical protein
MTSLSVHLQCMGKVKKKNLSVKSGRHEFSLSSLMGKVKKIKKIISKVRETWILSQFTYGQSEEKKISVKSGRHEFSLSSLMGKVKKKKWSVKSGRHEFSLSSLTMYGQSEEKKYISKVRETWILSQFTYNVWAKWRK